MDRFHIVVFNYERIGSFINNFHRISNFNPEIDKIFVIDCSINVESQKKEFTGFVRQNSWEMGKQINWIERRNWGIDQGGRIDYFNLLHRSLSRPKYIWQFQEHFLDLDSAWSINKEGTCDPDGKDVGGQVKGDVIPDNVTIDLNFCEQIYETESEVAVIYADRLNIGIFPYSEKEFFYVDGGNFSIRTDYALQAFDQNLLRDCKLICDFSYKWALFMEFVWGRQMTLNNGTFYDLVSNHQFSSLKSLKTIESEHNTCLHQIAELYYDNLYKEYEQKCLRSSELDSYKKTLSSIYWIFREKKSDLKHGLKNLLKFAMVN